MSTTNDFRCSGCQLLFPSWISLTSHRNVCDDNYQQQIKMLQRIRKKRRRVQLAKGYPHHHNVHKHKKKSETERSRPQDKGTSYDSTLLWAPPSLSDIARNNNTNNNDNDVVADNDQRKPPPETLMSNDARQSTNNDDDHDDTSSHVGGFEANNDAASDFDETLEKEEDSSNDDGSCVLDEDDEEEDSSSSSSDDGSCSEQSTKDEDEGSSVSSDDDEDDEEEDNDNDDSQWIDIDDKEHVEDKWTCFIYGDSGSDWPEPHKYHNNLPPYYVMQIHLMRLLDQHKTNDLSMFDRLMAFFGYWSDKYPDMMKNRHAFSHHKRKSTLKFLSKMFHLNETTPKQVTVHCSRNKKVTIPTIDFRAQVLSLVLDPDIMKPDNLIQDNFDPETLRPTLHYDDYGPNDLIDDVNSGSLYHKGIELYCNTDPPPGVDMIVPCPLIFYVDECYTDAHGALGIERVSFTLGFIRSEMRNHEWMWRHLGFAPNMKVGEGTNADNYDEKYDEPTPGSKRPKKKDVRSAEEKVEDAQEVYRVILQSVIDCCNKHGGIRFVYRNKKCILKPFILEVIGDAKGQNTLCCHYNSNGNLAVNCLVKCCKCNKAGLLSHTPQCQFITKKDIDRSLIDKAYAKSISYHPIPSAWNELPLADVTEQISGSTPFDRLHAFGHGTYHDGAVALRNLLGKNGTNKKMKDALDILFKNIAHDIPLNSEKRLPKIAYRFGATDLTRITATEREGNYLVMMISLCTVRGKAIFRSAIRKRKIAMKNIISTMELMLAYDQWCARPKQKWELDNAAAVVSILMEGMKKNLPLDFIKKDPNSKVGGSNGYTKIKFHAIFLFLRYMVKYGSACNFDSGPCEEHHRTTVTQPGRRTQRRYNTFPTQCMIQVESSARILKLYRYIQDQCPLDERNLYTTNSRQRDSVTGSVDDCHNGIVRLGKFTLRCEPTPGKNNATASFSHVWTDTSRQRAGIGLNEGLYHVLASWCETQDHTSPYTVEGYTSISVQSDLHNIIYRASELHFGKKRYDWAFVKDKNGHTYIAQMLGFFTFTTPGFPTPKLVQEHSMEDGFDQQLTDDTVYMAVRASSSGWSEEELLKKIVTPFSVTKKENIYTLPITCIVKPLIVVRDFGSSNSNKYIHVLPKKDWGQIFKRKIEQLMNI